MSKPTKEERQDAIAHILSKNAIESQDELLTQLSDKGFELTQATLSRDFREMKVAKTPDAAGNYFYRLPSVQLPQPKAEKYGMTSTFSRHGIINIEFSGQLAVIKTPGGYARGVAQDIDINNIPGIMATVAGNDTVLIVLRENSSKTDIINALKLLFSRE
ncbi:MAG: hypothetical protein Q4G48_04575 [Bacteroidia bacterium]|nr:hypothetical protein [Bacteroidia bacterium]